MKQITAIVVRELLDYDPETGILRWKQRDRKWFKSDAGCKAWNTRFSGKVAFTYEDGRGYLRGKLLGHHLLAHRVCWLHHYGHWPKGDTDHINGCGSDNRIANLRDISHAANGCNRRVPSNNTSGVLGVSWCKRERKWLAQIKANGRNENLGYFIDKKNAAKARKVAESKYGYHPNHGRLA